MPSVNGSNSSLIVAVDREGTHLMQTKHVVIIWIITIIRHEKEDKKRWTHYPNGTLLCNHKWVHPKSFRGRTSVMETVCSWGPPSPCLWFSDSVEPKLNLGTPVLCLSIEPIKGLSGDAGDEFNDTTEGGELNEAGAKTVNVRSSDVKFEAWRVNTWEFENRWDTQIIFLDKIKNKRSWPAS